MIRLGYACINTELPTSSRSFRLSGYSEKRMLEVAAGNIAALEKILEWNRDQGIFLFRITSALIPFGSHPVNSGIWKKEFAEDFLRLGRYIIRNNMRVSTHPGQYTVLNTPVENVFANTISDLHYHTSVLELMGLSNDHLIILHGGGTYGNKEAAFALLLTRLGDLPQNIKERLVLENDERNFTADEILEACKKSRTRAVLDVFHHQILPGLNCRAVRDIILDYSETWVGDGRQKIHYSDQAEGKNRGAHSEKIDAEKFIDFYLTVKDLDLDVMLETKNKQSSLLELRKRVPDLG